MSWLRSRLSLRVRLLAVLMLVSATVVVVAASLFYQSISRQLVSVVDSALEERALDLANEIRSDTVDLSSEGRLTQIISADGIVIESSRSVGGDTMLLDLDGIAQLVPAESVIATLESGSSGGRVRSLSALVDTPDGQVIAIVARRLDAVDEARANVLRGLLIAVPVALGLIAVVGWFLIRSALAPVRQMAHRAALIDASAERVHVDGPEGHDEFATLADSFNGLFDRIERVRLRERNFVADVSHELRTPLAIVRGQLELARFDAGTDSDLDRSLASSIEEIDRMVAMTQRMLYAARALAGQIQVAAEPTDVADLVARLIQKLPEELLESLDVVTAGVSPTPVRIDPDIITQILINLLDNAARHASSRINVETAMEKEHWTVTVFDDGPGFPPYMCGPLYERFDLGNQGRRDEHNRERFGLGLSIVASLAVSSGGALTIANQANSNGARVTVALPLVGP